MATKWDSMFGSEFYFVITNEERRYLGLNPIEAEWEVSQFYSKTNLWHKRTTVFWCKDTIKKIIYESKRVSRERITYESIMESDEEILSENREWLLPRTNRGKKKKVNATNIFSCSSAAGCWFHFHLDTADKATVSMSIASGRNHKRIATGEWDRIKNIRNDADFHEFMKYYMETCPPDYFDKIKALRECKHVTVKYKTGDVFRMEIDRFHYGYGIITGRIREIQKWKELPSQHSLRKLMTVPIMVRYYDICTTDANLSVEELAQIPLGRIDICSDTDILWGTHSVVGHKELQEDDIEFNLVCSKIESLEDEHLTVHTYDFMVAEGIHQYPESYNLYVEWGTASTILEYKDISQKLREYLKEYCSPHGGVCMGITWRSLGDEECFINKNNLLNDKNRDMREEVFRCLGLNSDACFDEFAKKYGGLTKEEILQKKL